MSKQPMKIRVIVWWVVLLAVVLTILLMLIPKPSQKVNSDTLPWKSHFNAENKLVALGLVLTESTPNDAVKLFGYDYEILAFSKKDGSEKVIEVYFPTMNVARIRGVSTLILDVSEDELSQMYGRGIKTTVNSSGNRQVTLLNEDAVSLMDNKIKYLTFVPKKNLPEQMLRNRFGEPTKIKPAEDELTRWFYPEKGLEIIVNPDGAEILQYYPAVGTLNN
jgi:hypothetical protein